MVKKIIKLILWGCLSIFGLVLLVFLFNPYTWFMRSAQPKQPKLSIQENALLNVIQSNGKFEIERGYYNRDSSDIVRVYTKIDTTSCYDYIISFVTNDPKAELITDEDRNLKIANYIKNNILHNSKNLNRIYIYWEYRDDNELSGKNDKTYSFEYKHNILYFYEK